MRTPPNNNTLVTDGKKNRWHCAHLGDAQRRVEDGRVGLLATGADGRHDEVEIVQKTVREQGILESVVEVGHNAELQTTVTQLLSRTTKEILMYHT